MIEYYTNKGRLKIKHILFSDELNMSDLFKLANYRYSRRNIFNPFFIKSCRQTRIIDLTKKSEAIFQEFGSSNRKNIRRALKKDLIINIGHNTNEFVNYYNSFAKKKNLKLISTKNLEKIKDFAIIKVLQNNNALAMCYYIIDYKQSVVRSIYSATKRLEKGSNPKDISIANRYLRFEAIKYFKSKKIKTYDLGGTAEHTKKIISHNIDSFKKEFGGVVVNEYMYESIPLFLALKFKDIFIHKYPY